MTRSSPLTMLKMLSYPSSAAFVETAGAVLALLAALPLVRAVARLMGELLV